MFGVSGWKREHALTIGCPLSTSAEELFDATILVHDTLSCEAVVEAH